MRPVDRAAAQVNRLAYADEGKLAGAKPNLRDRVYSELHRGHENQVRFMRAQRAAELIERNPEVAELLELLLEF